MNLLSAIAPYSKHIDAFEKGHGITDIAVFNKLVDIWNDFKVIPENAEAIYGNKNMKAPKTPYGCPTCGEGVSMMKSIVNWRKKLIREGKTTDMDFKGDADQPKMAKVTEPKKESKKASKKEVAPKGDADTKTDATTTETKSDATPAASTDEPTTGALTEPTMADKLDALKMGPLKTIAKDLGAPYSKTTTKPQIIAAILDAAEATKKEIKFPKTEEPK